MRLRARLGPDTIIERVYEKDRRGLWQRDRHADFGQVADSLVSIKEAAAGTPATDSRISEWGHA